MKRTALACLLFTLLQFSSAHAQVETGDNGTLSATLFSDYYWFASAHTDELEGSNGLWFRRVYVTYDHQISESFSGRVRLSAASEGDLVSSAKLTPDIKDAWLQWSNEQHAITAGITSTPTWGLVEDTWGYRAVEKSPLDLFDLGTSRDTGISFKGKIGADDKIGYHFMVGNGNGRSTELNKGKKFMLALSYALTDHITAEIYGDWNDQPGALDFYTGQAFLGYQSDDFNMGALYARHTRRNAVSGNDLNLDLISFFANAALGDDLQGFLRVDRLFDKNPLGPTNDYLPMSDQAEPTFLVAGVDITLDENVHLIPNIETILYKENEAGVKPVTDFVPRLTLFFKL